LKQAAGVSPCRVAVWSASGDERLLDDPGCQPPGQIVRRAGLVVGAAGPCQPPNGCWSPTTAPVGLSLDLGEVAGRVTQNAAGNAFIPPTTRLWRNRSVRSYWDALSTVPVAAKYRVVYHISNTRICPKYFGGEHVRPRNQVAGSPTRPRRRRSPRDRRMCRPARVRVGTRR